MVSDGDRLAPVTWLFGSPADRSEARPESPSETHRADESTSVPAQPAESPSVTERPDGSFDRISNVSMNALTRRGMSVDELRQALRRREFSDEEIQSELDRLLSVGLLDDAALAETLVRTLRDRKGLGRTALAAELGRRRIDSAAIEAALDGLDTDEYAIALELGRKRVPQLRSAEPDAARRRLGAFLMRKGYSGSVTRRVVEQLLGGATRASGPVFE